MSRYKEAGITAAYLPGEISMYKAVYIGAIAILLLVFAMWRRNKNS